jgi:hypothetical protein
MAAVGTVTPAAALLDEKALLGRAAALVDTGWCQRSLARDAEGGEVDPWSPDARSWSPLGGLAKLWYEERGGSDAFRVAYAALALATGGKLEEWNSAPWRTKQHALRAFAHAHVFLSYARRTLEVCPHAEPEA